MTDEGPITSETPGGDGRPPERTFRTQFSALPLYAKLAIAAGAIVVAFLFVGGPGGRNTLEGVVEGSATSGNRAERTCSTRRVSGGEQVRVTDGSGQMLGTGTVSEGLLVGQSRCQSTFTVRGVGRANFYEIELGGTPGPTWSREELQQLSWQIGVSG